MKLETKELSIHPHSTNYKNEDVVDLLRSIDLYGQLQPLIINTKKEVLKGNRRLLACQILKIKTVDVIMADIGENDTFLFLQLNKTKNLKSVDLLKYLELIEKLYHKGQGFRSDLITSTYMSRSDMKNEIKEMTGKSHETMRRLKSVSENAPHLIEDIDNGEITINGAFNKVNKSLKKKKALSKTPIINIDKSIIKNGYTLHNKSSENMIEVKDCSVSLIFCSPPYFRRRKYSEEKGLGNEKTPLEFINNLYKTLQDCYRVLKEDGSFYLNIADTFVDGGLAMIPEQILLKLTTESKWKLRHKVVWKKTNPCVSSSPKTMTNGYEYIFHLVKSKNYKFSKLMVPSVNTENGLKGMSDFVNDQIIESAVSNQFALQGYDIEYHPAPFPEKIVYFPILSTTDIGDIVLDPFNGSGTTGVVANKLGRKYIGYDPNGNYIIQSDQRLSDPKNKMAA